MNVWKLFPFVLKLIYPVIRCDRSPSTKNLKVSHHILEAKVITALIIMTWQEDVVQSLLQDPSQAVELCEKAIQEKSDRLLPYFYLGIAYLLQGNIEEAQGVWLWAIFEAPSELGSDERNQLLVQLLREQGKQQEIQENWRNSQLIYQQLQELLPEDLNNQLILIKTTLQTGELISEQLSIEELSKQLQQTPTTTVEFTLILDILKLACSNSVSQFEDLIKTVFQWLEKNYSITEIEAKGNPIEHLHLLGVIAYQLKSYDRAIAFFHRVITLAPHLPEPYNNLGNIFRDQGKFEEAKTNYQKALSLRPNFAEVYCNLGTVYSQINDKNNAANHFEKALKINPNLEKAYLSLAFLRREQGKRQEAIACYQQLLKVYPSHAGAYNNLGLLLAEIGDYSEAEVALKTSIKINPQYADPYNNLGLLSKNQGRDQEALTYYQKAIGLFQSEQATGSDFAKANCNLGRLFYDRSDLDKAEAFYKVALEFDPNNTVILNYLGLIYQQRQELDKATQYYHQAIVIDPDSPSGYINLGNVFKEKGEWEKAKSYYHQALEKDRNNLLAYYNLSDLHKFNSLDDPYLKVLLNIPRDALIYSEKKYLYFTLAKAWRNLGEYEKEWEALTRGNQLRREEISYSLEQDLCNFKQIRETFKSPVISRSSLSLDSSRVPIFIVGMPRSGTTLVEQIISSHSQVIGLGELVYLGALVKKCPIIFQSSLKDHQDTLRTLGITYLEEVAKHDQQHLYFTDKMPYNFQYIGLIRCLFPNAKVIHCIRHPLDVCLGNYQRLFTIGNYHSYDLEELGQYYIGYDQLMQHWYSTIPDFIYPLHYEKLVTNQEAESRQLLDFCGLSWEDKVLSYEENKRSIHTASLVQARQKIFTSSVNKWQKYDQHLQGLKKLFEQHNII